MEHYDSMPTSAIKDSEHHVGRHVVESGCGKWLLASNYHSATVAEASAPLVQELVEPKVE